MSSKASSQGESNEAALQGLLRAIASRNGALALRLLAQSPKLATVAIETGATRQPAREHFFEEIAHYAYAGDTALHIAAAAYQRGVAEALLAQGANVSARNRRGAEPLHYSADGGPGSAFWDPDAQAAVIELLVEAGADPNSEDKSGVAPLHRAVRTRCTGAVRALVSGGAQASRKNKNGSTPLHLAVQNTGRGGSGSEVAQEEQAKIIQLLLDHGARPSDKDSSGRSVTDCANADWIRALLGKA